MIWCHIVFLTCYLYLETCICRRTLRILFAMARGVPVLTPQWVYACLDRGQWLCAPEEYESYLHPRFTHPLLHPSSSSLSGGPRQSGDESASVSVFVGPCRDPSKRVIEGLADCFSGVTRTSSLAKAAVIIIGMYGCNEAC
jgi:hypothetical protein